MKLPGFYWMDKMGESFGYFIKPKDILYHKKSKYQLITVLEVDDIGRTLILDDCLNMSLVMEPFYHEPLVHIPVGLLDNPENILIIGGGDCGILNQAIKHNTLKKIVLCEIDEEVINVTKKFFPNLASSLNDKRVELKIEDGIKYLENIKEEFDIIIIDSTDPFESNIALSLISESFYKLLYNALKNKGIFVQLIADFIFYKDTWKEALKNLKKYFKLYHPLFIPIPLYISGTWGFVMGGKGINKFNVDKIDDNYLNSIKDIKTLTTPIIKGWFSLPNYIKDSILI